MYSWCYTVCVICQPSTTCTLFCSLYLNNWSGCFSCLASLLCSMLIHFLQGTDRESTLLFPCGWTVIQYYCEYYEYTNSQNKASNTCYISHYVRLWLLFLLTVYTCQHKTPLLWLLLSVFFPPQAFLMIFECFHRNKACREWNYNSTVTTSECIHVFVKSYTKLVVFCLPARARKGRLICPLKLQVSVSHLRWQSVIVGKCHRSKFLLSAECVDINQAVKWLTLECGVE